MWPISQTARVLLVLFAVTLAPAPGFAAEKLSLRGFTALYFERARQQDPGLTFRKADDETYEVTLSSGQTGNVYLGNAYRDYLADPAQRDQILDRYFRLLTQTVNASEDDGLSADTIVPLVRTTDYLEPLAGQPDFDRSQYITEPVVPGLMVIYAFDQAQTIRALRREDLAKLDLTPADVPDLARKNLARLYGQNMRVGGEDGFYYMDNGTSYESSMILLDIWTKENFPVKGEIVVFVPGRNYLLVTGSQDPEAFQHGRKVSRDIVAEEPHPMIDTPLVRRNGRWEVFKP